MKPGDPMYRIVDSQIAGRPPVTQTLRVLYATPKGVWIAWPWDVNGVNRRFVLLGDGRRFAYPTFEAALDSYRRRKQRQIGHARAAIDNATEALGWCDRAKIGVDSITYEEPELWTPLS